MSQPARARTPIGAIRRKPAAWRSSSLSPPQKPYSWWRRANCRQAPLTAHDAAHRPGRRLAALAGLRTLRRGREEQMAEALAGCSLHPVTGRILRSGDLIDHCHHVPLRSLEPCSRDVKTSQSVGQLTSACQASRPDQRVGTVVRSTAVTPGREAVDVVAVVSHDVIQRTWWLATSQSQKKLHSCSGAMTSAGQGGEQAVDLWLGDLDGVECRRRRRTAGRPSRCCGGHCAATGRRRAGR